MKSPKNFSEKSSEKSPANNENKKPFGLFCFSKKFITQINIKRGFKKRLQKRLLQKWGKKLT